MWFIRWTSPRRWVRSGCARSWPSSPTAVPRWCRVTAARSHSSLATGSWRCSARRSRWKITPSVHAWPPWAFRRRRNGTLSAAAVIGAKFSRDLLETLGIEPSVEDLVGAELIDQVRFTRGPEYAFHHPLIRTVAYDSQLKSDRAELHRRLAAVIESRSPASADENAALIAEHLEAAGDLHAAYGWQMRAAAWATNRDIAAARLSWERARNIADALPTDDPNRTAMRITPRTMLCGIAFRVQLNVAGAPFDELRQLCTTTGDKASLAIAMAGLG